MPRHAGAEYVAFKGSNIDQEPACEQCDLSEVQALQEHCRGRYKSLEGRPVAERGMLFPDASLDLASEPCIYAGWLGKLT